MILIVTDPSCMSGLSLLLMAGQTSPELSRGPEQEAGSGRSEAGECPPSTERDTEQPADCTVADAQPATGVCTGGAARQSPGPCIADPPEHTDASLTPLLQLAEVRPVSWIGRA